MFKLVISVAVLINTCFTIFPLMNGMYTDMWSSPIGGYGYWGNIPVAQFDTANKAVYSKEEESRERNQLRDDDLVMRMGLPLLVHKKASPRYLSQKASVNKNKTNTANADRANQVLIKQLTERAEKLKQIIAGLEKLVPETNNQAEKAKEVPVQGRSLKQPELSADSTNSPDLAIV